MPCPLYASTQRLPFVTRIIVRTPNIVCFGKEQTIFIVTDFSKSLHRKKRRLHLLLLTSQQLLKLAITGGNVGTKKKQATLSLPLRYPFNR
jgi:hypothetical protein